MLRSGNPRNPLPPASSTESDDSEHSHTTTQRRTTKTRRPRVPKARIGPSASSASQPRRNNKRPRLADEDEADNDHEHDNQPQSNNPDDITPNLSNYWQLGLQWGQVYADERLANLGVPKTNRPSAKGVFEAQCLQNQYNLHKTMLCIALKCSRKVMDEVLLEGPLSREPNMYTNYQTYSLAATKTTMPGKAVSDGFAERNTTVGTTWSTYNKDEQAVFTPRLFEPLCIATSEAYALTQTPLGIPAAPSLNEEVPNTATSSIPAQTGLTPLSKDELEQYVPIFKRLDVGLLDYLLIPHDLHFSRLKFPDLADCNISKAPYLRGGYTGKGDAHPKISNLQEAFKKKEFRGEVYLTFKRADDSQVSDLMLEKGPSSLTNNEVELWLEDIKSKKYTIVTVDKPSKKRKKQISAPPANSHVEHSPKNDASPDSLDSNLDNIQDNQKENQEVLNSLIPSSPLPALEV
ncbi:uncharacterized protein MELLADRAFT_112174 [Melampsora larici-populina 98AG31]|uniref:Uncharacterized protein n=1 Tax=Melampsora larici-populina (strain 98AG31 / pathotype 3-4-7) TaxID=747676 RepID=F4S5M1_MELLP|nr:uncharacterized protein MELLADRAFT_112174 [Melampsora larici-populina 98AG31]EGG00051.1 hypothetical protein MELLADRAFT_112174 [Melampsora larici-populina 98AG31]